MSKPTPGPTPGPWRVRAIPKLEDTETSGGHAAHLLICGPDGKSIMDVDTSDAWIDFPGEQWPVISAADAEFIVRACNSHEELLAALRELVAEADEHPGWEGHKPDTLGFEMARAAIAKAEPYHYEPDPEVEK